MPNHHVDDAPDAYSLLSLLSCLCALPLGLRLREFRLWGLRLCGGLCLLRLQRLRAPRLGLRLRGGLRLGLAPLELLLSCRRRASTLRLRLPLRLRLLWSA